MVLSQTELTLAYRNTHLALTVQTLTCLTTHRPSLFVPRYTTTALLLNLDEMRMDVEQDALAKIPRQRIATLYMATAERSRVAKH